jgi:hypothetical protein
MEASKPRKSAVLNMALEHSVKIEETDANFVTRYGLSQWLESIFWGSELQSSSVMQQ